MQSSPTKRLSLKALEEWKRKAEALDTAVAWLSGRMDSEKLMTVYALLTRRQ